MVTGRRLLVGFCVVAFLATLMPLWAQEAEPEKGTSTARSRKIEVEEYGKETTAVGERLTWEEFCETCKKPLPWLNWGAQVRIRQEMLENTVDLDSSRDTRDPRNYFRTRYRVWARLGDFLSIPELEQKNGLSFYVRVTGEPRFHMEPGFDNDNQWTETVWDNLFVDYQRIGGWPISVKVGRQDLVYGVGFVLLDGTPLDGSRTIYNDAAKATLHLDAIQTQVDFLAIDNQGIDTRLKPFDHDEDPVDQFDIKLYGVYAINKSVENNEFHAYYLYKDENPLSQFESLGGRIVQTAGALARGTCGQGTDYYLEVAGQWGDEGDENIESWGLSSDLGYTFKNAAWTPRLHVAYEWLRGDDPDTDTYEGWDNVLARWPHWSELFVFRTAAETGRPGLYTNLHRIAGGASVNPIKNMKFSADYSLLLGDENQSGGQYDDGDIRGHLLATILTYRFNKWIAGHLWFEYFWPGDFYTGDTDEAYFARWELTFDF